MHRKNVVHRDIKTDNVPYQVQNKILQINNKQEYSNFSKAMMRLQHHPQEYYSSNISLPLPLDI